LADPALPATVLANDRDVAIRVWDVTASAAPALAKNKWRQEEAAKKQ
jgi:hypothetical protein